MADEGAPQLPQNMGRVDRVVRALVGVAAVAISLTGLIEPPFDAWIRVASIFPFATALLGWCPAYQIGGFLIGLTGLRRDRGGRDAGRPLAPRPSH